MLNEKCHDDLLCASEDLPAEKSWNALMMLKARKLYQRERGQRKQLADACVESTRR